MPFSAGVFSRLYNWATEQASPPIEISKLDAQEDDVATALSNCLLRDGTGIPTTDTPWNSKKITGLANATADTDALNLQMGGKSVAKSATTSRSSTTSLADDPHLVLALSTGTWAVECWFPVWGTTAGTGGISSALAFSGTSTNAAFGQHSVFLSNNTVFTTRGLPPNGSGGAPINIGTGITSADWVHWRGVIVVSVAGNLSLQWAQTVSNSNATNVGIGGWLIARRVA